jgi:hypothetical protein
MAHSYAGVHGAIKNLIIFVVRFPEKERHAMEAWAISSVLMIVDNEMPSTLQERPPLRY